MIRLRLLISKPKKSQASIVNINLIIETEQTERRMEKYPSYADVTK